MQTPDRQIADIFDIAIGSDVITSTSYWRKFVKSVPVNVVPKKRQLMYPSGAAMTTVKTTSRIDLFSKLLEVNFMREGVIYNIFKQLFIF